MVLPFVGAAAIGLVTLLAPPYHLNPALLVVSALLLGAVFGLFAASLSRARRSWVDPLGPLLAIAFIGVVRDAFGGTQSGVSALVALPIVWLALFGSRRDLWWAAGCTAAMFAVPLLAVGAPAYPLEDWRRAVLWVAFASLVAPVVQAVVRRWQAELVKQRELTEKLSRVEERWRVLLGHLPETTVLAVDPDLRLALVSGAGAKGPALAGAAGRRIDEVVNPKNLPRMRSMLADAFAGREGYADFETTSLGSEQHVQVVPLPADHGRRQALVLARDVSRDRARERAVVTEKERAERLFQDAPEGVAVLDRDGTLTRANPALAGILGVPASKLVGRQLGDFVEGGRSTIHHHLTVLRASDSRRAEAQWTLRAHAGQPVHVAVSSTTLWQPDREPLVLTHLVDVSERRRYEQQLAHLADHDPLTGLANRRRFEAELTRHLDHCARYGASGALLMMDLDNFKEVNDTLGHAVGDELIVSVAALLRRAIRGTDVVARLGGDEFAVILTRGDRDAVERVAAHVIELVRAHARTLDGTLRRVTASVGAVLVDAGHVDPGELLAAADMTMYDAKELGRDRHVILDRTVHRRPRTAARMDWAQRVERALETDAFELHLQPILDLHTNRVTAAEVLLRLVDGNQLVPPARFLYVAERTGLIVDLDSWVLDRSVALLADLQQRHPGFRLEVNVSGRSIGHPEVETRLGQSLARHGADPSGLVLEITETAAVADVETTRAFAERLQSVGGRFALDDFGAGFGSFYYLKHLLFDFVKIDGQFVSSSPVNRTDRLIMSSIVGIAQGMGKQTVAEFVTDAEVLETVRRLGVDHAQGYHVGRPVCVAEFLAGQGDVPRPVAG